MVRDPAGRALRQLPRLTVATEAEVVTGQGEVVPGVALGLRVRCRRPEVSQYRQKQKESQQEKIHR